MKRIKEKREADKKELKKAKKKAKKVAHNLSQVDS